MKALFPAYERWHIDSHLKTKYGFGIDEIECKNNKVVGKTEEITRIIERENKDWSFMKNIGFPYIDLMDRYKGTPEFSDALFTLKGGKFESVF